MSVQTALPNSRIFHGWYVVAAAFAITFVGFGCTYTFSAFLESPQRDFGTSPADRGRRRRQRHRRRHRRHHAPDGSGDGAKLGLTEVVIGTLRYRGNDLLTRLANANSISAR